MNSLRLSALGWIDEPPFGNRLRWHIPAGEIDPATSEFFGLPEVIILERRDIEWSIGERPPSGYITLDEPVPDINLLGTFPVTHRFSRPLERLRFRYDGRPTRLLVRDSKRDRTLFDRVLADGETVDVLGAQIDQVVVHAFRARLRNVFVVDAYKSAARWEEVARIRVAGSRLAPLPVVLDRYPAPPTITPGIWADLVSLAEAAISSHPGDVIVPSSGPLPDGFGKLTFPNRWTELQLGLAERWEHAVLFGHGYVDGPRGPGSGIDVIDPTKILTGMGTLGHLYRIRDDAGRFAPSNQAFCPNRFVPPLQPPSSLAWRDARVRLTDDASFSASFRVEWTQSDAVALGIDVEEEIGASAARGTAPAISEYRLQPRSATGAPNEGASVLTLPVPFHDVTLRGRARAIDGWDRESPFTPWTAPVPLTLVHAAAPPRLAVATNVAGATTILLDEPVWKPDVVVAQGRGRVEIWRRSLPAGRPRHLVRNAAAPLLRPDGLCEVAIVDAITDPSDFVGGTLVAGRFRGRITSLSAPRTFLVRSHPTTGPIALFGAGPVQLHESAERDMFWTQVADFDAATLSSTLTFRDVVPGPGELGDVLTYAARVSYLGRRDALGGTVQAVRTPAIPLTPPPFTVHPLGVDFFGRTGLRVHLTTPATDGRFKLAWASGNPTSQASFVNSAIPGELDSQDAYGGVDLYSIAALPVQQNREQEITVGVQRVNGGGGRSDHQLVRTSVTPRP